MEPAWSFETFNTYTFKLHFRVALLTLSFDIVSFLIFSSIDIHLLIICGRRLYCLFHQQFHSFSVSFASTVHHALYDLPSFSCMALRATLQPLAEASADQPVAYILLIEARLRSTGSVGSQRPVPGGVRSKKLVDKNELLLPRNRSYEPKFEFGVGEDDAPCMCVVCGRGVELQSSLCYLCVEF